MELISQFISRTPVWVWVLLGYLIFKGVKARKPAETSLLKLAIIPVIFTAWGLFTLITLYGVKFPTLGLWLLGLVLGSFIGWRLLAGANIWASEATGAIHRPADLTLLPLLLVTFTVKYVFGVMAAVSPELLQHTGFLVTDLLLSGIFTGVFIGKFMRYRQAIVV